MVKVKQEKDAAIMLAIRRKEEQEAIKAEEAKINFSEKRRNIERCVRP